LAIKDTKWDDCGNISAVLPDSYTKPEFIERAGVHAFIFSEPKLTKLDYLKIVFDKRQNDNLMAKGAYLPLEKAILYADGVPYIAPEFVLYLKASEYYSVHPLQKPKTEVDFKTTMPLLSDESKKWLTEAVNAAYPDGHGWLDNLTPKN